MKKALAIVMALALLSTCMVFVSADADATVTVATVEGPFSAGDGIAIPVTITEWSNAYATVFVRLPEYDENLLTFDGFESSSTDFGGALGTSGPDGFALISSPTTDKDAEKLLGGEVCIMHFVAAADINTSTEVSVAVEARGYTNGSADGWMGMELITVETINGGINVEEHVCVPSDDIQYDETDHWYVCETIGCGNIVNKAPHEGGKATCSAKAECSVCGAAYGNLDDTNHAGGTEVRNASATYTGDTYCLGCDAMIEEGNVIGDKTSADVIATVATVEGPFSAGDEIVIPVTISEWANAYAAISVSMPEYDESLLTFDGFDSSSTGFSGALGSSGSNGFGLLASPGSERDANKVKGGEVCIMYFYAVTDINVFVPVSVVVTAEGYTSGAADEWTDSHALKVETVNGGILVEEADHTCVPSGDIQHDGTDHWYNCEVDGCDKQLQKAPHEGGEATCVAKAQCSVCGAEYGDVDATKHVGETEVRDDVTAGCASTGYTGDTYCLDCGEMIEEGKTVPATGQHTGGKATCYTKAECTVCGNEYGNLDATNHAGGTEIRNDSETYTGDTYCLGCDEMIKEGKPILPNTGYVVVSSADALSGEIVTITVSLDGTNTLACYGATLVFDETELELVDMQAGDFCYMVNIDEKLALGYSETDVTTGTLFTAKFKVLKKIGDCTVNVVFDADATANSDNVPVAMTVTPGTISVDCIHEGGEATCSAKAKCEKCGQEYGEIDADNHKNTEVRNESDSYTGDTYCLDCGEMIEEGVVIILYGDADGDKSVTIVDAMVVARYSGRLDTVIDLEVSDVNGDGEVDIIDAMLIARYSGEMIDKFPVEQ